ncbi:MAG: hypothetical protein F4X14_10740 [Caldilineaceae bacterium SB0661_bin_32]|uniref:Sulfatase-like hydrolase/transferase n=1 Tax=Caldilineaceae bacterium SB0661_bin_32 TaxID=2605255 RepID=A0A6B1D785_9CHLR|nr:hypothetical protein [Caldilineaceae bacterium SB0661_bin_32]
MGKFERAVTVQSPEGGAETSRAPSTSRGISRSNRGAVSPWRFSSDLSFWFSFFVLHALLFLPVVLMDREDGALLPVLQVAGRSLDQIWMQLAVWRREPDLLRFNSEIVVFIALWAVFRPLRHLWVRRLFVFAYLFLFFYYLYEGASLTFFSVEPVFYTQLRMATEGFSFFLQNARVTAAFVVGTVLLIVCGAALVARLARFVLPEENRGTATRVALVLLALLVAVQAVWHSDLLARPEMVFSSISAKLVRNIGDSRRIYQEVRRTETAQAPSAGDSGRFRLVERPPVYIIFSESYGSVLYKRNDWRARYKELAERLDRKLAESGWHVASALSLAPTWGGGSWMSYTSALFGLRVSSDPQYYALLDKYQAGGYPDLGNFLKGQGYRYYRLTALSMGLPEAQWKKYASFYGVDRWLQYEDLAFVGPEYGWGPAPPDQYSLNFARETVRSETDGPYLFFTITQNSHYPWAPQPVLVESWRQLNRPGPAPPPSSELIEHVERRQNYWNAIEYQLEMLTDFVLSEPNEQAIFVLVGDHQPPRVSRREDGWDTPFHIIAKDARFVASFMEYGFTSGLAVWEPEPTFRHEGLRSLFVRQLLAAYGDGAQLPPYFPEGLPVPQAGSGTESAPH